MLVKVLILEVKAAVDEALTVMSAVASPVKTTAPNRAARAMERASARGAPVNTLIDIQSLRNLILQKAEAFKKVAGVLIKSCRRLLEQRHHFAQPDEPRYNERRITSEGNRQSVAWRLYNSFQKLFKIFLTDLDRQLSATFLTGH